MALFGVPVGRRRDGQIVVDEGTYREVAVAFPDARREELALKGKSSPVPAYWIPP